MNWVLESIRKSLKTLCRRQSVALVSRISPSTCFLISWVLEIVCCENSCRNCSSYLKNKHIQRYQYASILCIYSAYQNRKAAIFFRVCGGGGGRKRAAAFDSTKAKQHRKNYESSSNSGHFYLVSGETLKCCLIVLLQGSQTKGKMTKHCSSKNPTQTGLWNHGSELTGSQA